jgi:hypothetical protein
LQRVIELSAVIAKLLILLGSATCRETGQDDWKQARTCICGLAAALTHKVFHRCGGEMQKLQRIINLQPERELLLKILRSLPDAFCSDG